MDLFELIKDRRAVRSFTDGEVAPDIVDKILQAGRYSPSPQNSQPWHFILIKNKMNLAQIAATAKHANFISKAALLIVVTVNKDIELDEWLIKHNQHIYSGAGALQNMWLTAASLEVGACWVSLDEQTTKKLLNIPKNHIIIGALAIGKIDKDKKQLSHCENDRKALTEMLSFEKFGQSENSTETNCYTCLKLVPKSAARSFEGEEYIQYFCGLDCYVAWQKQTKDWLDDKNSNE